MKVCFISFEFPPETIGGMGTYAEQLVRGLEETGTDVYVITRGDKNHCEHKTFRISIQNQLYWRRFHFINRAVNLFHKLSGFRQFDLVHLNGTYPIARSLRLPTVCTFHAPPNVKQARMALALRAFKSVRDITDLLLKNPVGSLCDFATAQVSDKVICPSPSLVRDLLSYCFADERQIHVIPNGLDLEAWDRVDSSDDEFLTRYDLRRENFLLYMGRLSSLKGVEYLIEAFKIIREQHPNLKLVIAGRGELESFLRRIADDVDGVVFVGYVNSLRIKKLLYEASLAVVLPSSIYEVSPMVVLEAMACSKPVIGTNVGGVPFMIRHGKNGFIARPRDPKALFEYIKLLYENPDLRREMGFLSRQVVEKDFTIDQMVNKTLKIYNTLA